MKSLKLLHFADAHIDMANFGRHDAESGLPIRVMDFLRALDQIIERALAEPVDLVIFAGDAYKDRNPHPTYQREWGKRIMRLSQAGIPTLLLAGNHDVSPAAGRAHALQEFDTLQVPHVHVVANRIEMLTPAELGVPVQILGIPWISYHGYLRRDEMAGKPLNELLNEVSARVADAVEAELDNADPDVPLILVAHASVQGAIFGSERQVMLGSEMVLGGSTVNDKRIDYVALGHIHKHQDVSNGRQPPVVYPGSIERIDFGELREKKGYVLADVAKGQTAWEFVELETRKFRDFGVEVTDGDSFMADIMEQLPSPESVKDAICRLRLTYRREHEPLLDEAAIGRVFRHALSFHIAKNRLSEKRSRLGDTVKPDEMTPDELLAVYWQRQGIEPEEMGVLLNLTKDVLGDFGAAAE